MPVSTPRLVALAGPREGESFTLGQVPLAIGRHSDNQLQLRHASVSRRHCVVESTPDGQLLRDLDSLCGVFVNGTAVTQHLLKPGDYLKIGESLFIFITDEQPSSDTNRARSGALIRSGIQPDSTVEMSLEELQRLLPQKLATSLESDDQTTQQLALLLRAANELHALVGVGSLLDRLAEIALVAVPAQRVAIVVADDNNFSVVYTAIQEDNHDQAEENRDQEWSISSSVCRRVIDQQVAVLSNDLTHDLPGAHSLLNSDVRSVICVPLLTASEPTLLYADSCAAHSTFERHHLEVVSAVVSIASMALQAARRTEWLEAENRRFRQAQLEHDVVGDSAAMEKVLQLVKRVAPTDLTVLVTGESGTGKELIAMALHRNGPRRDKPFVAVNCATLSDTLLESQLFGHERGSFTGAVAAKQGHFELAHEGTLFLDEVAEIPVALQAKLLRALETREIQRVGGTRTKNVDVRVVAATNRELSDAVAQGSFRCDLFHRLNVFSITLPPLRERRSDIPLLANHFANQSAQHLHRPISGLAPATRKTLVSYDWPGNVRELRNAIERAVVLATSEYLLPEDLPEAILDAATDDTSNADANANANANAAGYHAAVAQAKRTILRRALDGAEGDFSQAAERLGLNRTYLHRLVTSLGLRAELDD